MNFPKDKHVCKAHGNDPLPLVEVIEQKFNSVSRTSNVSQVRDEIPSPDDALSGKFIKRFD
jgi:hypothetical protein